MKKPHSTPCVGWLQVLQYLPLFSYIKICLYTQQSQPDGAYIYIWSSLILHSNGYRDQNYKSMCISIKRYKASPSKEKLHLTFLCAFRNHRRLNLPKHLISFMIISESFQAPTMAFIDLAQPRVEKSPIPECQMPQPEDSHVYLHNWSYHICTKCFSFPRNLMHFKIWTKPWIQSQLR